ncbi:hypothetical protein GQ457_17G007230 [Hibiscus cannabinus]
MRNDAMGSWRHATERVVTRPRRPRVSRGLDLSGMLSESSLTLWRQKGKEDQGITFVQVRFCGNGSIYKQWGGSVFCIFGLEYRYSSVVSVPEFNTRIRVSEGVSVPKFLNGTQVSVLAFEYRYWLPENGFWSSLKHDSLRLGP